MLAKKDLERLSKLIKSPQEDLSNAFIDDAFSSEPQTPQESEGFSSDKKPTSLESSHELDSDEEEIDETGITGSKESGIPTSVMQGQEEDIDLELNILAGSIPKQLKGSMFVVGALSPKEKGSQIYNGDGVVYRFFFSENGKAIVKSRVMKPPCYYADKGTQKKGDYEKYRFRNHGLARVGKLGSRNQLNTGLTAMGKRVFVTYDGGRPYEIDPLELQVIKPLGAIEEWQGAFKRLQKGKHGIFKSVFFTCFTPAHPVYAPEINKVFTAEYSSGFSRVLPEWIRSKLGNRFKRKLGGFTDLLGYSLEDEMPKLERWPVILDNEEPVIIDQSLHQISITRNYIVLADIAFPMELSQVLIPFIPRLVLWLLRLENYDRFSPELKRFLASIFLRLKKQRPYTKIYIINRRELENNESGKSIVAKKIVIPREISHFITDYDDSEGRVRIHTSHNNAWDVTEWIRDYDDSIPNAKPQLNRNLFNFVVGPMDVGFLGNYSIDGETGALLESRVMSNPDCTWSISLYTYDQEHSKEKIKYIYWLSWGFSTEVIPNRIYEAYRNYPYRGLPLENLHNSEKCSRVPVQLLKLNTETMEIEDRHKFGFNIFASSPQFIPASKNISEPETSSGNGYIICTVYKDSRDNSTVHDEIWIFDAHNLKRPICKLGHEKLDLWLTIHSTWLADSLDELNKEKRGRPSSADIRRMSLYSDLALAQYIEKNFPKFQKLFQDRVYSQYINQNDV